MLTAEMNAVGMRSVQSGGDADTLIATNAVDIANSKPKVVIGKDTNFLILLISLVNEKRYRIVFHSFQTNI